jgi:hypothetical protein
VWVSLWASCMYFSAHSKNHFSLFILSTFQSMVDTALLWEWLSVLSPLAEWLRLKSVLSNLYSIFCSKELLRSFSGHFQKFECTTRLQPPFDHANRRPDDPSYVRQNMQLALHSKKQREHRIKEYSCSQLSAHNSDHERRMSFLQLNSRSKVEWRLLRCYTVWLL